MMYRQLAGLSAMTFASVFAIGTAAAQVKAPAGQCITDLALTQDERNPLYPNVLGWWDVDNGGATGGMNRTEPLGSHWVTLSAQFGPMGADCIEDIRLKHTKWGVAANSGVSADYLPIAYWDVADWGSVETAFPGTYAGSDRMTLFIKRVDANAKTAVTSILTMRVNFSLKSGAGISAAFDQAKSGYFKTNSNIGWWSVDRDGICVGVGKCTPSTSPAEAKSKPTITPAYAGLQVIKSPYVKQPAERAKSVLVTGQWVKVSECAELGGAKCGDNVYEVKIGVEKGRELSKSSTLGASLSLMVGAEAKGTTGAFPGGEVTAKLEVTGTVSAEQQKSISDSFTQTMDTTNSRSCSGAAAMWQWVSTMKVQWPTTGLEEIRAPSNITRCAAPGQNPPDLRAISWGGTPQRR